MATRLATPTRNSMADAAVDRVDTGAGAGKIRVYDGTQPASADDPIGAVTLLAEFDLPEPAYGASSSGQAALQGTPLSATGLADGTASWFRVVDGQATPATVFDGAAGTSGTELTLNTATISTGVNVEVTAGSFTQPAS